MGTIFTYSAKNLIMPILKFCFSFLYQPFGSVFSKLASRVQSVSSGNKKALDGKTNYNQLNLNWDTLERILAQPSVLIQFSLKLGFSGKKKTRQNQTKQQKFVQKAQFYDKAYTFLKSEIKMWYCGLHHFMTNLYSYVKRTFFFLKLQLYQ